MREMFTMKLTEEMVEDVQRLGTEVDARMYIINNMFEMHKNDADDSIFTSVPFKSYQKEMIEYKNKYDDAVSELGKKLIPMVEEKLGRNDVNFDWKIDDFSTLEVNITLK